PRQLRRLQRRHRGHARRVRQRVAQPERTHRPVAVAEGRRRHRPRPSPRTAGGERLVKGLAIKLGAFAAVSLLCLGWLAGQIGQLRGPAGAFHHTYPLKASFTDATGLVGGDDVRLAGVRIGKVGGLQVDRGKALVSMKVDSHYKLPAGSRFELHWKNLLGQRFVEIVPPAGATLNGPLMAKGTKVDPDRTQAAADLSELL